MIRVSNTIQFVNIWAMLTLTEPTSQPINQLIDPIQCRQIVFAIYTCVNTSKSMVFFSILLLSILLSFDINPHASERVSGSHTISNVTHKRIMLINNEKKYIIFDFWYTYILIPFGWSNAMPSENVSHFFFGHFSILFSLLFCIPIWISKWKCNFPRKNYMLWFCSNILIIFFAHSNSICVQRIRYSDSDSDLHVLTLNY